MKIVKQSILEACHGAILEAADIELERIIANIGDINTNPVKKRSMTITVEFVPTIDRKKINMKTIIKSKIEPAGAIETTLFTAHETTETGEVVSVLKEAMTVPPGQINLDGIVKEQEIFVIGYDAHKVEDIYRKRGETL